MKILVSTVLFDDEIEIICERVPIEKVAPLTQKKSFTRGCTAQANIFRKEKFQKKCSCGRKGAKYIEIFHVKYTHKRLLPRHCALALDESYQAILALGA